MSRIITSIILLMTMGFCGCGLFRRNTDNIDGGVKTYNSGEDSPKVIESTEIISFKFEVSLYNIVVEEESELVGRKYKLSAVLEDGAVKSKIKWRDRAGAGEECNPERRLLSHPQRGFRRGSTSAERSASRSTCPVPSGMRR